MSQRIELKTAPEVKRVILAGFPSCKKRAAYFDVFPGHGVNVNSFWDGGSRAEFAVVELATLNRKQLPTQTHPFFDLAARGIAAMQDQFVTVDHAGNVTLKLLPEGFALIEAGTSCGKAATARVLLHPNNFVKALVEGVR
jgi:hypothetical protein